MNIVLILEWLGCICGLAGSMLLALNCTVSRWAWWLFLSANFSMLVVALHFGLNGLLVQQLGFTITSLVGLRRAGFLGGSSNYRRASF